ncbi:MAG TPA: CIA30 family protein [Ignavibacteriaceae bacterium]|nr:CIA30 family protein [Ignavibacteriaceae bacterium]
MKIILFFILTTSMITGQENQLNEILLNSSIMKDENKWRTVNDDVMGGLSSSKAIVKDDKIVFSGNVSLENNGGFASLRSPVKDYNFKEYYGIEIRIKGDGKRYSISMKETTYFTGLFYTSTFETKKDEWITVKIPFDKFRSYYFGREVNSKKKIPLNNIKEISLLIGDKQQGRFKAEIEYLGLY